jgi:hypothetical protein
MEEEYRWIAEPRSARALMGEAGLDTLCHADGGCAAEVRNS